VREVNQSCTTTHSYSFSRKELQAILESWLQSKGVAFPYGKRTLVVDHGDFDGNRVAVIHVEEER
jgi:hypothetical protein